MKLLATVSSFAIICVASVLCAHPGFTPLGHPGFASSRAKRFISVDQLTPQDVIDCTSAVLEYQCSSANGYAQSLVDISLGCTGYEAIARELSALCARSDGTSGETCGAAVLNFDLPDGDLSDPGACYGAVEAGSCPSACRSFLEASRNDIGCCINTYLNRTESPLFEIFETLLNYTLWTMCDVDLPASACEDAVSLDTPDNVRTCTEQELFDSIADYECRKDIGQPLVDVILQQEKCYPFARQHVESCGRNSDDRLCGSVLADDILGSLGNDPILVSLQTNCSGSTCNPVCQGIVADARERFGCCINIYNSSDPDIQLSALSYSYWESCGVETPGFCPSTLSSTTITKAFSWLVVAVMVFGYILG